MAKKKVGTEVSDKELQEQIEAMKPIIHNAPESLEEAIERIQHVEMLLEDLVRAVEIASMTEMWNVLPSFIEAGNDHLNTKKIRIEHKIPENHKVTIVEGEAEDANGKKIKVGGMRG